MTPRRARLPAAALSALALAAWLRCGPLPAGLFAGAAEESTTVVDRRGVVLYEARASDGARSARLDADALPATLVSATLAAEDHRFWSHSGIDAVAVARAAGRNLRARRITGGGSTITQQVAKLLRARHRDGARGLVDKIGEAVLALRLEHRFTKREILALYLNLASYGNQLVGAERASRAYFGVPASMLTPAQAAFLASLPQRPTAFNPYRNPEGAAARARWIVSRMAALGWLSPEAARDAAAERLALAREPAAFLAPHFVARVLSATPAPRPARLVTTLDAELQRDVEGIIRAQKPALDRHGAHNVAAVVLDNASGEWLAWEGSGDHADTAHGGAIDGVVTPRQPGSALKPFTYALAFETGESPATVLADVPSYFPTAQEGIFYSPKNYDGRYRGPLLARRALAGSENVPAVALAARVGVPALLRFLRRAGLTTFDRTAAYYGVGVTLGDAEVRLDELVSAYAAFARGGATVMPTLLRGAGVPPGADAVPSAERLVSARTAFWISDILADDDAREYAFGRGGSLEFPFAVAAKTGTSQAYHDNWAIGYTQRFTVGVWVGNFDRTPLVNSSGVTGAGPIFHAIMLAAERRAGGTLPDAAQAPTAATSAGLVRQRVCALSGLRAGPWCPAEVEEWLPEEADAAPCTWHQATPRGVAVAWPAAYRSWAREQGLLDRPIVSPLPPRAVAVSAPLPARAEEPVLAIVNPPAGAVYLIDPTLRAEFQTLPLRAATAAGDEVEWLVDGHRVGRAQGDAALEWPLAPGRHLIVARDRAGRQADAAILVK